MECSEGVFKTCYGRFDKTCSDLPDARILMRDTRVYCGHNTLFNNFRHIYTGRRTPEPE